MTRSMIAMGILVLFGLVGGGVVAAALLSRARRDVHGPKAETTPIAFEVPAGKADTSGLEFRIRELEARAQQSTAPVAASAPPSASVDPSPEESSRRWLDEKRAREAQVAAEPDDRRWSQEATASFRKEFESLGVRDKFKVTDVECKTTSCLAKLTWGSYSDAVKSWHHVLLARYTKNCARQVFVPHPEQDQGDSDYEGTVFLDCTGDRAQ
jgi:hypothetical protein